MAEHFKPQHAAAPINIDDLPEPDWQADAIANYTLAYRVKALLRGSVRPSSPAEMYEVERHGVIP